MAERFPKRAGCFGNNFPSKLCFARRIKRTSSMHRRKNKWHKLDWWMIDRSHKRMLHVRTALYPTVTLKLPPVPNINCSCDTQTDSAFEDCDRKFPASGQAPNAKNLIFPSVCFRQLEKFVILTASTFIISWDGDASEASFVSDAESQPVSLVLCPLGHEKRKLGNQAQYKDLMEQAKLVYHNNYSEFKTNGLSMVFFLRTLSFWKNVSS